MSNADLDPNLMIPRTAYRMLAEKEAEVRAERDRLREALGMAIYHADNLRRYIDKVPVRDLDESGHGLERAREMLIDAVIEKAASEGFQNPHGKVENDG